MGKSDTYSKNLLQDNDYFADTVNNVLFKGRVVIYPNELQELDPTELTIVEDIVEESIPIQKYRDVLKQAVIREDKRAIYAIIRIENQTSVHYAMPVKNLLYDAIRYAKQVEKKTAEYKKKDNKDTIPKLSNSEFLSGWRKEDKLRPVITITIYFGADEWDGPRSIHEMLEEDIDKDILLLISDYKIYLLEPCSITNWDAFKSDIGLLFHTIAVSNTSCGIKNLVQEESEEFSHVDNKIVNAINFYTKVNIQVNNEKEETDMCYAMKTADVCDKIEVFVDLGKSLKETIAYILSKYSDDKDITESFITEQYNSFLQKK